jgi:hypothetical protein
VRTKGIKLSNESAQAFFKSIGSIPTSEVSGKIMSYAIQDGSMAHLDTL